MADDSDDPEKRVHALREQLAATRELPVERTASRWIGEADAVASDLADADLPPAVLRERVGHVRDLLANVDGTGHPEADEHVERATRIAAGLLERLGDE